MLKEEIRHMMEAVIQILRNCGFRTAGSDEAALVLAACRKLPGCASRVLHGNTRVIEDMMRCSPITSTVFVPMSFFRLSQSLHSDELYSEHMIAGCSLDAARNCVDASLLVGMMDPHQSFCKLGSVAAFKGTLRHFRECMSSIIVGDASSAEAVASLMQSKGCTAPVSLDDRMRRSKFASARNFRINLPRFGIKDVYEAESPAAAVQKALDEAFERLDERHYYRRKPKEFMADFYLMDPVIASDVVQDVTNVKSASIMEFQVGDTVETVTTNGFPGGQRGMVVAVVGDAVQVRFKDGRNVTYDMAMPGSAAALRPVRRL